MFEKIYTKLASSIAREMLKQTSVPVVESRAPEKAPEPPKKPVVPFARITKSLLKDFQVDEAMPYEPAEDQDIPQLDIGEWTTLCKACADVVKFKELETVKRRLINSVISDAVRNAESMEQVNFYRASIHGIQSVFDEIHTLAAEYKSKFTGDDEDGDEDDR